MYYVISEGEVIMLDLFQIGIGTINDSCGGLGPVVKILKLGVLRIVCIIIPIALIGFAIFDLGKAIIASDDKEVKAAQSRLIKRLIYGIVIFLVPFIITLVMNLVAQGADETETSTTSWAECWNSIQ